MLWINENLDEEMDLRLQGNGSYAAEKEPRDEKGGPELDSDKGLTGKLKEIGHATL